MFTFEIQINLPEMKYTAPIAIFLITILFSSCYHKNVMEDHADDVITVLAYSQDNKDYIITSESIFQVNSKSSDGGMTTISGHHDIRVSVYALETGELIFRKKIGKIREGKNTVLLGCTPGKLWLYSELDDQGLYSVDPLNFEIKRTQEQFLKINPELKGKLAVPEYYSISDFYSFDLIEQKPVITDNQGYRYYIDPVSLKAVRTDEDTRIFGHKSYDYFTTSVRIADNYMSLDGELRKKIRYAGKELHNDLDFLEGKFIMSQNFRNLYQKFTDEFKHYKHEFDSLNIIIDTLKQQYGTDYWYFPREISERYRRLMQKKDRLQRKTDEYNRIFKNVRSSNYDDCLLQSDTNCFFIAHRNTTNKDAFMCISKICKQSDSILSEAWETTLPNVFFDASAAEETDAFKEVFSKGDPDFDFEFFDIVDDKLILIYALNMVCIDIHSGKILWQFIV